MSHVLEIKPSTSYLLKIEGAVTVKGGVVTIENVPLVIGGIKKVTKAFPESAVVAYRSGKQGFVIYSETAPLTKVYGKLLSGNDDRIALDTDSGKVVVNNTNAVSAVLIEADEDSKEAREAMRLSRSRVKIKEASKDAAPKKKKKAK